MVRRETPQRHIGYSCVFNSSHFRMAVFSRGVGAAGSAATGQVDVPLTSGESSGRFHANQAVNAISQAVKAALTPSKMAHLGPLLESSVLTAPVGVINVMSPIISPGLLISRIHVATEVKHPT